MQVKLILNEEVIVSASVYYPINRIVNSKVWAFMLKTFLYHWIVFSSSFDTQIINNTSKTNF